MKKTIVIVTTACAALLYSCAQDAKIGAPIPVEPDYALPQVGAPQAVNDRIVKLFNDYGSYFLYDLTQKDFEWTVSTGFSNSQIDSIVLGNPAYVGPLLDFLENIWLRHVPENMKKGMGIPYRVFLVDAIRRFRVGYPPGMEYYYSNYKVTGKSIAFAGVNEAFGQMTAAEKTTRKNELVGAIFDYYASVGLISFPEAFYAISNYATNPTVTPVNVNFPDRVEAYLQAGFLPGSYGAVNPNYWLSNAYMWTNARSNDFSSFRMHLFQRTDEQMTPYLSYPLIKQKFDLLVDHFRNEYGIDVRGIANAAF
ncbi:MAG: hypothetical protein LBG30_00610 [Odoribacteraceae bacterium]|jgi:hypothetical protein|nr:hypothetical protein [Odoribacteraceae bacterium]